MLNVGVVDRATDLVDAVVDLLAAPLADPFQSEWVSVPSLGFRSWLRFELARHLGAAGDGGSGDGVVANIDMPFPGSLRWRILRAHGARAGRPEGVDPWEVDRLVWAVLDVMSDPDAEIDERLRRSTLPPGVTLASRAGPIADLFDRYGVHRPQMVNAWADGHDVDAEGQPLPQDRRWQPRLYRAVRGRLIADGGVTPPAERLVEALEQIRSGDLDLSVPLSSTERGLPPRLAVVGQSILTAELGPVLSAVARQAEVTVMLLSPSAQASVAAAQSVAQSSVGPGGASSWAFRRKDRPLDRATPGQSGHPLVNGWGRRPLESALLLGAGGVVPTLLRRPGRALAETTPLLPAEVHTPVTLLGRIQADVRADAPPAGDHPGPVPDPSLQIHAAPGRTRQVEVLRDVVLGLLRDNPDLAEDEIAVLCPQLEEFAPVITAVLGPTARRGEQPDGVPTLRYTLVDRDARSFNPVLAAMQTMLDVMPGRFDTGSVRDLLHSPAVRARFDLDENDLGLLSEWIDDAGVRWGLDGDQRRPWGHRPGASGQLVGRRRRPDHGRGDSRRSATNGSPAPSPPRCHRPQRLATRVGGGVDRPPRGWRRRHRLGRSRGGCHPIHGRGTRPPGRRPGQRHRP
jgi:exodeoxyribonuclease V gamma subunit